MEVCDVLNGKGPVRGKVLVDQFLEHRGFTQNLGQFADQTHHVTGREVDAVDGLVGTDAGKVLDIGENWD